MATVPAMIGVARVYAVAGVFGLGVPALADVPGVLAR
jgi:hypothetical protein